MVLVAKNGEMVSNCVPFALGTLPECLDQESNDDLSKAQKVELPIVVNGRMDRSDDWDVFEVQGKAGETIVVFERGEGLGGQVEGDVAWSVGGGPVQVRGRLEATDFSLGPLRLPSADLAAIVDPGIVRIDIRRATGLGGTLVGRVRSVSGDSTADCSAR